MIFDKEKRTLKKIYKIANSLPLYNDSSRYDYNIEKHEGLLYIKVFYTGTLNQSDLDNLYRWGIDRFTSIGYSFHGIVCYNDNHEVCLDFIKD